MMEWVHENQATLNGIMPDGQNIRFVLTGGRVSVGRQGDIRLSHNSVSRHHAVLECRSGVWQIFDSGSRNGTFVNDVSVQCCNLKSGDIVRFGCIRVKFSVDGESDDELQPNEETRTLAMTAVSGSGFGSVSLVGRSAPLKAAVQIAVRAAKSDAAVLICGESGTGKELFARLVYEESGRRKKKYLAVNCSAIEQSLLSSALFGHEKGAFTGADRQKKGLFEEADGGTLFLDEIGELSQDMQVKLLRVLQEGEFMRVGGTEPVKVDVRVITATNRNLLDEIKEGRFREDLYYRLNVIQIKLPPLRERPGDVEDLVRHFTEIIGGSVRGVSQEAMAALCAYNWPGNIRQLRNMMERTIILSENDELQLEDFPEEVRRTAVAAETADAPTDIPHSAAESVEKSSSLADWETAHILAVLEECGGNKKLASERLGISRSTLYEKLKGCPSPGHSECSICPESGQKPDR